MSGERFITSGNAKHYATPSYRHQSALGGKLEKPSVEPCDWFTWPVRITMIGATLVVSAHAMGWI